LYSITGNLNFRHNHIFLRIRVEKYAILVTARVEVHKILTFEGHIFVISALYAYSRFLAIICQTLNWICILCLVTTFYGAPERTWKKLFINYLF